MEQVYARPEVSGCPGHRRERNDAQPLFPSGGRLARHAGEGSLEGDQGRAVADGRRAARHDPSLLSPVATSGWPLGPISGLVAYAYICNFTVCSIRGVSMLP